MNPHLDLELGEDQKAIARSVAQLARAHTGFSEAWWKALCENGVPSLATPEGFGGALEIVAAMESIGWANAQGPIAATLSAMQLLDGDLAARVAAGEVLVSLGEPPLMPWAAAAGVFIALHGAGAFLAEPRSAIEPVDTLGGERWGRLELERVKALDRGRLPRALAIGDIARAAQLAGLGERLLEAAADHAKMRRQFGRTIGEFQAVSHPLADCAAHLSAAKALARTAAFELDAGRAGARTLAAGAFVSACRAALAIAHAAPQALGALGALAEGPIFPVARKVRQLASEPPGEVRAIRELEASLGLGGGT
jgi:alkylation response protein AidB-like acyl-CoA dehydrogenase